MWELEHMWPKELMLLKCDTKENQSWIFTGKTDAEAEAPILWLPDAKNWLIEKYCDAGKDWKREEKGTTEEKVLR